MTNRQQTVTFVDNGDGTITKTTTVVITQVVSADTYQKQIQAQQDALAKQKATIDDQLAVLTDQLTAAASAVKTIKQ